jgi:hypothetical protein
MTRALNAEIHLCRIVPDRSGLFTWIEDLEDWSDPWRESKANA